MQHDLVGLQVSHESHGGGDGFGVVRPDLPQEPVGIAPHEALARQHPLREIRAVEGDDGIGPGPDRHGEHVFVGRIGQHQPRLDPRLRCDAGGHSS